MAGQNWIGIRFFRVIVCCSIDRIKMPWAHNTIQNVRQGCKLKK